MITYTGCTNLLSYRDEDGQSKAVNVELIACSEESITADITGPDDRHKNTGKFKIGRYGGFTWLVDMENQVLTVLDDPYDIEEIYYQLDDLPVTGDRAEELSIAIYYLAVTLWRKDKSSAVMSTPVFKSITSQMRRPVYEQTTLFR